MDLTSSSIRVTWSGPLPHQTHLNTMFSSLQSTSTLVDVSLICQTGEMVKCHKIVLAAASNLFKRLFVESTGKHPVVILPHIAHSELQNIVEYIYRGEISVGQNNLESFLAAATNLEISGVNHVKSEAIDMKMEFDQCAKNDACLVPQDLSMKTHLNANKRRRVDESNSVASCLPSPAHDSRPETPLDNLRRNNLLSSYNMSQFFPDHIRPTSQAQNGDSNQQLQTMQIPTGIFAANLDKSNETMQANKPKMKEASTNSKLPTWSQTQLQEAIESVITQKLRFTQASSRYGIPKGTLYDNILGKSKRMVVLEQVGLTDTQELSVLEFCCEISSMPYNRRTSRSLRDVIQFIACLKKEAGEKDFTLSMRQGFKWWWAFTKKHNIISLYYEEENKSKQNHPSKVSDPPRSQSSSPENLLNLLNNPSSVPINIPTSSLPLLPFLGLNSHSKYSLKHPDFILPPRAHANTT